jgi:hypothetical protein
MKIRKRKKDRINTAVMQALNTILDHEPRCYIHPEIAYSLISSLLDIAEASGDEKAAKRIIGEYMS